MSPEAGAVRPGQSELRTRTFSALVLGAVALAAGIAGGLPFAGLVAAFAVVAFWEWTAITRATEPASGRALLAAGLVAGVLAMGLERAQPGALLIGVACFFGLLVGVRRRGSLWMGFGVGYVGLPAAGFVLIRQAEPSGWAALLFILAVVWATDIGGYFGGRGIGGKKLWPRVSPKKTWSGALVGLASGAAAGIGVAAATGAGEPPAALLIAVALSGAAQAGDLFESAVKRRFGVKDSGRIIPGHGGVLDRVDGLFGAAAIALLLAAAGLGGGILALPEAAR